MKFYPIILILLLSFISVFSLHSKQQQIPSNSTFLFKESIQESSCPCIKRALSKCPSCGDAILKPSQLLRPTIYRPPVQECPCASRSICPPCVTARTQKFIHEQAQKEAQKQAQTEESLSKEAELQAKLFSLAVKFAKEASQQEELARKAALALQQASSKAQIARNKMKRATNQARLLALKALNTISESSIGNSKDEKENNNPSNGYKTPESLEEAVTNSELEGTSELNLL